MGHRNLIGYAFFNQLSEKTLAQPAACVFKIPACAPGHCGDIFDALNQSQISFVRQFRHEFCIGYRFWPAQRMIQMHDHQGNSQLVLQRLQNPQQSHGIGAPRDRYTHTTPGPDHAAALNSFQRVLLE